MKENFTFITEQHWKLSNNSFVAIKHLSYRRRRKYGEKRTGLTFLWAAVYGEIITALRPADRIAGRQTEGTLGYVLITDAHLVDNSLYLLEGGATPVGGLGEGEKEGWDGGMVETRLESKYNLPQSYGIIYSGKNTLASQCWAPTADDNDERERFPR